MLSIRDIALLINPWFNYMICGQYVVLSTFRLICDGEMVIGIIGLDESGLILIVGLGNEM